MILQNFYNEDLAQASYLVGCAASGEAIVIDALRDIEPYLNFAQEKGLRIVAATETHIHADYLSGTRELAAKTGAQMYLSDEGNADWKYEFADQPGVTLLKHNDRIKIGNLSLQVVHTPGHTPEHLSFLLTDHPASEIPHSVFTGDFIFAGDVGRPDLLERAANFVGTMEAGAKTLYKTIQASREWPDHLQIWPGHGAGSACGKSLGAVPVTTMGYERQSNWAFKIATEDEFVAEVLAGQPDAPVYFKEMKRLNKLGPTVLGGKISVSSVASPVGTLVDVRPADESRAIHFADSLILPLGKTLTAWAGWFLSYTEPVTFIADSQHEADLAAEKLSLIGLDVVAGWILPDALRANRESIDQVPCGEIRDGDVVLDVRTAAEWSSGHIKGSTNIPLNQLTNRLSELPSEQRVVVHCKSGGRSPIAMSILRNAGVTNSVELEDGFLGVQASCAHLIA